MLTGDFDFALPKEFIAQRPASPRDHSKLLVYDTARDAVVHRQFFSVIEYLHPGDVLVVNRSKVIPARILFAEEGREREVFLLRELSRNRYEVLVRPGKAFPVGKRFMVSTTVSGEVVSVQDDGSRIVEFSVADGESLLSVLPSIGSVPLPPYIAPGDFEKEYQTVYAAEPGSVAAPTAGLHFTEALLDAVRARGVEIVELVLHVGRGTFAPVSTERITDHVMHSEAYAIDADAALRLNAAMAERRRIIAVGTTSVRVLESAYDGGFQAGQGSTSIFIYPGKHKWQVVDAMITNFHLPKSTLLMLVASFLEHKGVADPVGRLLALYEEAKAQQYRFFSFGDAMMVW